MSLTPSRAGARFERWSIERYRQELKTAPQTTTSRISARSRSRSRRLLAGGMPSEDQIHRECAAWVFAHEALLPQLRWLTHVPNGGKRSRGEAGKMRAMGVRKGVVDWLLPFSSPKGLYRGLAIEIKSQKGALSDEQDEFLQTALADGWLVGVARSLEQFTELVMKWQSDRS